MNSKIDYIIKTYDICCHYNESLGDMSKEHYITFGLIYIGRDKFCNLASYILGKDILDYQMADQYTQQQYMPYKAGKYLATPALYLINIL